MYNGSALLHAWGPPATNELAVRHLSIRESECPGAGHGARLGLFKGARQHSETGVDHEGRRVVRLRHRLQGQTELGGLVASHILLPGLPGLAPPLDGIG